MDGGYSAEDDAWLNHFIMELATHCPNMPNVHRVYDRESANAVIYYCPLDQMSSHVTGYVEGNWGYFHYWYVNGGEINKIEIAIATDVNTTESKKHLLQEELIGGFGLSNDHFDYTDSILYGEWTTTQEPSDVDWLMLNMLYDPDLRIGMTASEAYDVLGSKIRE